MKWSWQVGKIAGINLKIHPTFILILVWVGFSTIQTGGTIAAVIINTLIILIIFLSVILHELGHALMAKRFGISTQDITLLPIGGIARLERMPENPKEEFLVAIAGPAVNVVIGTILFTGLLVAGFFSTPLNLSELSNSFWLQILTANIILVLFNLLPAFPMDGGRVLRAVLASRIDHVKATRIAANVGRIFAVAMGIAGFFANPWLILTAIFIWTGAGAEAKAVELKASLKGLVAKDALISQYYQVEANQPLADVYQLSMETGQNNIPVVSNSTFLGIIRRTDLLNALNKLGTRAPAYAAIGKESDSLHPELPLIDVLAKFGSSRVQPVIENRRLLGLITPESIQQRMWLNKRVNRSSNFPTQEKTETL